MNLLKFALVVAIGVGAYNYWQQHRHESPSRRSDTHTSTSSELTSPPAVSGQSSSERADAHSSTWSGFVSLPAVSGQSPSAVLVVAAEDCPHEDAQRANQLAEDLSRSGLPVIRTHSVGFDIPNGEQADLDTINRVMTGQLPVVFVRGRAKANPTLEEVLAEFKGPAQ